MTGSFNGFSKSAASISFLLSLWFVISVTARKVQNEMSSEELCLICMVRKSYVIDKSLIQEITSFFKGFTAVTSF